MFSTSEELSLGRRRANFYFVSARYKGCRQNPALLGSAVFIPCVSGTQPHTRHYNREQADFLRRTGRAVSKAFRSTRELACLGLREDCSWAGLRIRVQNLFLTRTYHNDNNNTVAQKTTHSIHALNAPVLPQQHRSVVST